MSDFIYHKKYTKSERDEQFKLFNAKNVGSNHFPIILEASRASTVNLDETLFSVSTKTTVKDLVSDFSPNGAPFYLFYDNILMPDDVNLYKFYLTYRSNDSFLYLKYSNSYTIGKKLSTLVQTKINFSEFKENKIESN